MTRITLAAGLAGLVLIAGCARARPQPAAPPARDLVALAADPESGEVGRVVVTAAGQSVELANRSESTVVTSGSPPAPPAVLSDAELMRVFGAVIAAQPPAARHILLYFQTGGDTLTAESKDRLSEVLEALKGRVAPEVTVIGHTDTTGTPDSNRDLGLRRATLIRDLLLQTGLDAGLVDAASHGEADLLVPTPDNTPEPRNRRVEVTVR